MTSVAVCVVPTGKFMRNTSRGSLPASSTSTVAAVTGTVTSLGDEVGVVGG
ncbi:Uncharacterised protein [Mycobacteroides abscessus subsp. abscessus]|nr:Uncharacterised protein [Mycobacteroides abscessus subsp. abscessus]